MADRQLQYRVLFDFEIDFSNSGGIQGQGFRLDIEGSQISDQSLGDYLIEDMHLLMVGEVRILNKSIILEAHKRSIDQDNNVESG
ncbi:MAG: hypothetical protein MJK13_13935 [Pseudomonadales bacterium]|nr:hypothetical protein [Pseudomonadales bacterium]